MERSLSGHEALQLFMQVENDADLRRRWLPLLKHLFSGDPNEPLSVRHEVVSPRTADTSGSHVERSRYQRGLAHRETAPSGNGDTDKSHSSPISA
jgi:hypothetical protein